MIADYHVHTPYCGHAMGKTIEYIESAIRLGMSEVGFTDHLGRYYLSKSQRRRYWDWGMHERDIARYFSELLDLKEVFDGRITVRIGLEVDYVEGAEHLAEEVLSRYPFDFLLGSIHCLPALGWKHVSQYVKVDQAHAYAEYFKAVDAALGSGMFQSLAHLDFIWRYVSWPEVPQPLMAEHLSKAVAAAASRNVNIEVNANAFLWSQINDDRKFDLFDMMLDCIKKYNAPITVGSDAHTPEHVGKAFPQIIGALKKKGIESFTQFEQKRGRLVQLG